MKKNYCKEFEEWFLKVQQIAGEEFGEDGKSYADYMWRQGATAEETAEELMK